MTGATLTVYRCDCCHEWDVRDENNITYHVDHHTPRDHPAQVARFGRIPDALAKREAIDHAHHLVKLIRHLEDREATVVVQDDTPATPPMPPTAPLWGDDDE